jgi:hypothetical protein
MVEEINIDILMQEIIKIFYDIHLIKIELYKYQINILEIFYPIITKYKINENNKFRNDIYEIDELIIKYEENHDDLIKIINNHNFESFEKVLHKYANMQIKLMDLTINLSKKLFNENILSKEEYKELYSNLDNFINKKNELKKYVDSDKFNNLKNDFNNLIKVDKHPTFNLINILIKHVPYMFKCEEHNILDSIFNIKYDY